jgi:hypothetical protein
MKAGAEESVHSKANTPEQPTKIARKHSASVDNIEDQGALLESFIPPDMEFSRVDRIALVLPDGHEIEEGQLRDHTPPSQVSQPVPYT